MRPCETDGCDRPHYARGMCKPEYRAALRAGTLDADHPVRQVRQPVQADGRRVCTVPGCDRTHHMGGRCRPHELRFRRTGDVRADEPIGLVRFGQYNRGRVKPTRQFDLSDTGEL